VNAPARTLAIAALAAVLTAALQARAQDKCAGVTCSNHGTCVVKSGEPMCACHEGYAPDPTTGLSCLPHGTAAPPPTPAPAPQPAPAPAPAPPPDETTACKDKCWAEYADCVHTNIPVCQVDSTGAVVPAPGQTGMTTMQCATLARPCDDKHSECLSGCKKPAPTAGYQPLPPPPPKPAARPSPLPAPVEQNQENKRAKVKKGLIISGAVGLGVGYFGFGIIGTGVAAANEEEIKTELKTDGYTQRRNPTVAKATAWVPFAGPFMMWKGFPNIGPAARAGCLLAIVLEIGGTGLLIAGLALPKEEEGESNDTEGLRGALVTPLIGPGSVGLSVRF